MYDSLNKEEYIVLFETTEKVKGGKKLVHQNIEEILVDDYLSRINDNLNQNFGIFFENSQNFPNENLFFLQDRAV